MTWGGKYVALRRLGLVWATVLALAVGGLRADATPGVVAGPDDHGWSELKHPEEMPPFKSKATREQVSGDGIDGPLPKAGSYVASGTERSVADRIRRRARESAQRPAPAPELSATMRKAVEADQAIRTEDQPGEPLYPGTKAYEDVVGDLPLGGVTAGPSAGSPSPGKTRSRSSSQSAATAGDPSDSCAGAPYCAKFATVGAMNPVPSYWVNGWQRFRITNRGTANWPAGTISLGYHLKKNGVAYSSSGMLLTRITQTVAPGATVEFSAIIEKLPAGLSTSCGS